MEERGGCSFSAGNITAGGNVTIVIGEKLKFVTNRETWLSEQFVVMTQFGFAGLPPKIVSPTVTVGRDRRAFAMDLFSDPAPCTSVVLRGLPGMGRTSALYHLLLKCEGFVPLYFDCIDMERSLDANLVCLRRCVGGVVGKGELLKLGAGQDVRDGRVVLLLDNFKEGALDGCPGWQNCLQVRVTNDAQSDETVNVVDLCPLPWDWVAQNLDLGKGEVGVRIALARNPSVFGLVSSRGWNLQLCENVHLRRLLPTDDQLQWICGSKWISLRSAIHTLKMPFWFGWAMKNVGLHADVVVGQGLLCDPECEEDGNISEWLDKWYLVNRLLSSSCGNGMVSFESWYMGRRAEPYLYMGQMTLFEHGIDETTLEAVFETRSKATIKCSFDSMAREVLFLLLLKRVLTKLNQVKRKNYFCGFSGMPACFLVMFLVMLSIPSLVMVPCGAVWMQVRFVNGTVTAAFVVPFRDEASMFVPVWEFIISGRNGTWYTYGGRQAQHAALLALSQFHVNSSFALFDDEILHESLPRDQYQYASYVPPTIFRVGRWTEGYIREQQNFFIAGLVLSGVTLCVLGLILFVCFYNNRKKMKILEKMGFNNDSQGVELQQIVEAFE